LDFAFDIHTEIGSKCTAGKVNNHLVPISHVLVNGDQVEILTTKNQKPSEDWLRFVVTSKAKSRIKDALKEDNKTYITDGKEIITKRLKIHGLENNLETLNQLRAYFNKKDYSDLFYSFGKGYIQPDKIKRFKAEREAQAHRRLKTNLEDEAFVTAKSFEKAIKKSNGNDSLLIGDDLQQLDYTLSQCCNPIPGDDVFGFLTVNEGIKVHRTNCPNSRQLLSHYGNRVIKAQWSSQMEKAYLAIISLKGVDRVGMIQDISKVISEELHINMRGLNVNTEHGVFEGEIKVFVFSTKHMEKLMDKLLQIKDVEQVSRAVNQEKN
jgi:GTP diphosphokinase / guanosine-3',5'-bis(diphosphate) 3'-diphosphatase